MANSQHIPGLIRGHEGTIIMVDHGKFEGETDHITVKPERRVIDDAYKAKWGDSDITIPVTEKPEWAHMQNFLDCVRSRQTPNADIRSAAAAGRAAHLGNQPYRTASRIQIAEPRP